MEAHQKIQSVPFSLSPAIDCKLCADVCECPIDDNAILHRRFASRLYNFSHGGARSFVDNLLDFGRV